MVRASTVGVLAIIATASAGPVNTPATFTRRTDAYAQCSDGPLVEFGGAQMNGAGKPALLIRPTTSTAASYVGLTIAGAGTSVVTDGVTAPADDYDVTVTFGLGGTVGVLGITYTYTLDGGESTSAVQALGTATTLTIPHSGVSFALAAGTILAGQTIKCTTKCARMTNGDLLTALEALRVTRAPWDEVLIFGEADATMAQTVNDWLVALEAAGVYGKGAQINARMKNAGETEAQYLTAMTTALGAYANSTGIELLIGADGAFAPQPQSGLLLKRPTALFSAVRAMSVDIATDLAYVDLGPLGVALSDANGNPSCHDENIYPGLDDHRFVTLTTFDDPDGPQGVYITNPNLFSANGSDYVYLQHTRVMNLACRLAKQRLTRKLSKGVRKDPATAHILEVEAKGLEGDVQGLYDSQLVASTPPRCTAAQLVLSRTDDLSSNQGSVLTGDVQIESLAYIKGFELNAKFVKTISAAA